MASTSDKHSLNGLLKEHPEILTPITSWDHFESTLGTKGLHDPPHWSYRGHNCSCWKLETSLERRARALSAADAESWLLREFVRRYHHYSLRTPSHKDTCYWLSLMQHHGAPTRLLDWTYSRYVAAFFAVEEETECSRRYVDCTSGPEAPAHAVFALNVKSLRKKANIVISKAFPELTPPSGEEDYFDPFRQTGDPIYDGERFDLVFRANTYKLPTDFVYPVNSYILNERLTIQQGMFVAPGNVMKSFEQNLSSVLTDPVELIQLLRVYTIPPDLRTEFLLRLHRMNINRATLFPGLDGFASSLRHRILDKDLVREVRRLDELNETRYQKKLEADRRMRTSDTPPTAS